MPRASSTSTSRRAALRYLATVAVVASALAGTTAAFVGATDPFQVLRRARGTPNFYTVAEYQIPGIARHYPHEAVAVGTSTSNNFRSADIATHFGGRAINLSLAGSTIQEQRAVLDTALATRSVRQVIWGIDPFAFGQPRGRSFPYYLYRERGLHTAPYFFSLGAIAHGIATLWMPDHERTSLAQWIESSVWDTRYTYGRAQVLTAWAHRNALVGADLPDTRERAGRAVAASIAPIVAANPDVQFHIVLLPYTVLYAKLLLEDRPREFEGGGWIATAIVEQLAAAANARVFDFRDAREITHDLDAFKDLLHFSGATSRRILADMAAGRRRASQDSCVAATDALRAEAGR